MMYRTRAMRRSTKNPPNVNPAISFRIHINSALQAAGNSEKEYQSHPDRRSLRRSDFSGVGPAAVKAVRA